jgi:integrase
MKTALTDRAIKAAKPRDRAYDMHDSIVPGLLVEVRPSGLKRLALLKRFPGSRNPTRRLIGQYGAVTLEQARTTGRRWLELLQGGIDPAVEVERARQAEARKQRHTFAHLVGIYTATEVIGRDPARPRLRGHRKLRNALDILVALFGDRPIAEFEDDPEALMAPLDLIAKLGTDHALLQLGARKKPRRPGHASKPSAEMARALFTFLSMTFNFAVGHGGFGLSRNPIAHIKKSRRFGSPTKRQHSLDDEELAALWVTAGRLPASQRRAYRALVLTGLRLNEVAGARWDEIAGDTWTVPPQRMKGRHDTARAHAVPITMALRQAVLDEIPESERTGYIFPGRTPKRPISAGNNVIKKILDREMLAVMRERALARGEDPSGITLPRWRNHDLRRVIKSGMTKLGVRDDVSEAVLAHKRVGLSGTYDVYARLVERRAALEQWAAFVTGLVGSAASQRATLTTE